MYNVPQDQGSVVIHLETQNFIPKNLKIQVIYLPKSNKPIFMKHTEFNKQSNHLNFNTDITGSVQHKMHANGSCFYHSKLKCNNGSIKTNRIIKEKGGFLELAI